MSQPRRRAMRAEARRPYQMPPVGFDMPRRQGGGVHNDDDDDDDNSNSNNNHNGLLQWVRGNGRSPRNNPSNNNIDNDTIEVSAVNAEYDLARLQGENPHRVGVAGRDDFSVDSSDSFSGDESSILSVEVGRARILPNDDQGEEQQQQQGAVVAETVRDNHAVAHGVEEAPEFLRGAFRRANHNERRRSRSLYPLDTVFDSEEESIDLRVINANDIGLARFRNNRVLGHELIGREIHPSNRLGPTTLLLAQDLLQARVLCSPWRYYKHFSRLVVEFGLLRLLSGVARRGRNATNNVARAVSARNNNNSAVDAAPWNWNKFLEAEEPSLAEPPQACKALFILGILIKYDAPTPIILSFIRKYPQTLQDSIMPSSPYHRHHLQALSAVGFAIHVGAPSTLIRTMIFMQGAVLFCSSTSRCLRHIPWYHVNLSTAQMLCSDAFTFSLGVIGYDRVLYALLKYAPSADRIDMMLRLWYKAKFGQEVGGAGRTLRHSSVRLEGAGNEGWRRSTTSAAAALIDSPSVLVAASASAPTRAQTSATNVRHSQQQHHDARSGRPYNMLLAWFDFWESTDSWDDSFDLTPSTDKDMAHLNSLFLTVRNEPSIMATHTLDTSCLNDPGLLRTYSLQLERERLKRRLSNIDSEIDASVKDYEQQQNHRMEDGDRKARSRGSLSSSSSSSKRNKKKRKSSSTFR